MVDDEREAGMTPRKLRDVADVVRVDRRELEHESVALEQLEGGLNLGSQDPVRIRLLMDQMPHAAKLRTPRQLRETYARRGLVVQPAPADDAADPVDAGGELEHVVGVVVAGGALDEDCRIDADGPEEWVERVGLERTRDRPVLLRHPRLRYASRVPEVMVSVYCHGRIEAPRPGGVVAEPRRASFSP
jgi:hypothetical protein